MSKVLIEVSSELYEMMMKNEQCKALLGSAKSIMTLPDNIKNGEVLTAALPGVHRVGTVLFDKNDNILATNVNINWWNDCHTEPFENAYKVVITDNYNRELYPEHILANEGGVYFENMTKEYAEVIAAQYNAKQPKGGENWAMVKPQDYKLFTPY